MTPSTRERTSMIDLQTKKLFKLCQSRYSHWSKMNYADKYAIAKLLSFCMPNPTGITLYSRNSAIRTATDEQ
ncbi:hypothetical protein FGO68_gene17359 [Halteria grandinella]|uniref:Uncharacterized protein n=1 Tax=Halteria grandinella TaxID=5974 RepID=A0A8J8P073_HALGN|nr:hypothetical protein FGO68_gene17359 [Halteria grandinella]